MKASWKLKGSGLCAHLTSSFWRVQLFSLVSTHKGQHLPCTTILEAHEDNNNYSLGADFKFFRVINISELPERLFFLIEIVKGQTLTGKLADDSFSFTFLFQRL